MCTLLYQLSYKTTNKELNGRILSYIHSLAFNYNFTPPLILCINILFPYKTTCPTYLPYRCGTIIYFREYSRITDYCYSRSMVLSLWKSFLQGSSAGISCLAIWKNGACRTRTYDLSFMRRLL